MKLPSLASCQVIIRSEILRKNTNETQQVNFERLPSTGGTFLHKRLSNDVDVDMQIESARHVEVVRQIPSDRLCLETDAPW